MVVWIEQKYGYEPAAVNFTHAVPPLAAIEPVSHLPSGVGGVPLCPEVDVCGAAVVFVHITASPTDTLTVAGSKVNGPLPVMDTVAAGVTLAQSTTSAAPLPPAAPALPLAPAVPELPPLPDEPPLPPVPPVPPLPLLSLLPQAETAVDAARTRQAPRIPIRFMSASMPAPSREVDRAA